MTTYRFARRSFLAAVGGAIGLRVLLDNMVAAAAGAQSPPRFLLMQWPLGTVRYRFKPTSAGSGYQPSAIIQPFEDAGLRNDMTVLYGLSHTPFDSHIGGGHEAGTVMTTTGAPVPGVRVNGGEGDDACAGGPSFDQIFLKNAPSLQTGGVALNVICDARVESQEVSTQCLSYDHSTRSVMAANGGTFTEAVPLLPDLSPLDLYLAVFSQMMPGGAVPSNQAELLRAVKLRKSVLDFSLRELDRIKSLAPGSEKTKLDYHAEVIRKVEVQLQSVIDGNPGHNGCAVPSAPNAALVGRSGSHFEPSPTASASDEALHEQVGQAHFGVIMAAFQCDLARVATFQWAPGASQVAFKGLYPGRPDAIYMHAPLARTIVRSSAALGSAPPDGESADALQFLANVQTWYNQKTADLLATLKNAKDALGNSLLDHTVVPYVTDVNSCALAPRTNLPAFVFGGKALGMQHGNFLDFELQPRSHNDLWTTVAQAYLGADPLSQLAAEKFDKTDVAPIAQLWSPPA
jgi:hypothetical protein